MTQFVALLSTGKGTWAEVAGLINKEGFNEIYILTNAFGKDKFTNLPNKKVEVFAFDFEKDIKMLTKDFVSALRGHVKFGDLAVNISSGGGKEHMALISALLSLGVGLRFVTLQNGTVSEVTPSFDSETGRLK
ncbi:hypothetical protein H6503_01990 [Candidatus Woesearchaeota archaeon]|nr:hypothetical protein [Candidatus Woesearchaeota archaeon]